MFLFVWHFIGSLVLWHSGPLALWPSRLLALSPLGPLALSPSGPFAIWPSHLLALSPSGLQPGVWCLVCVGYGDIRQHDFCAPLRAIGINTSQNLHLPVLDAMSFGSVVTSGSFVSFGNDLFVFSTELRFSFRLSNSDSAAYGSSYSIASFGRLTSRVSVFASFAVSLQIVLISPGWA